jgi:RES domain-containing protein
MTAPSGFAGALKLITPLPLPKLLYRGVRLNTLLSKDPPVPLFVSASQNRYNVAGVKTLYFGENVLTAYAETVQEHAGLLLDHPTREHKTASGVYRIAGEGEEPVVVFATEAMLQRVIDLTDQGTRSKLGVSEDSLLGPWRWEAASGRLPFTQQLGNAVFESNLFEAIRYPSEKALDPNRPAPHANLAIFVDRLEPDSFLQVSDVSARLQGRLP